MNIPKLRKHARSGRPLHTTYKGGKTGIKHGSRSPVQIITKVKAAPASTDSASWPTLNRRRVYLIHKDEDGRLTTSEAAELQELEKVAERTMRAKGSDPDQDLRALREKVSRIMDEARNRGHLR